MPSFEENVELLTLNTFHIQARARYLVRISSMADFIKLLDTDIYQQNKILFLGGGSNVLLTQDFDGLIVKNEIKGITILTQDASTIVVKVGSGENWHEFVLRSVQNNWGGIENLSLIPGTVGAAPMQNIGAYGVEAKETLEAVEAVDRKTGEIRIFNAEECKFGYRESIFKHDVKDQYYITGVTFRLTVNNHKLNISYGAIRDVLKNNQVEHPTIKDVSEAVIAIRKSKLPDPAVIGNAGSFFKNPSIAPEKVDSIRQRHATVPTFPGEHGLTKVPAGWLIEQCGWKGKTFDGIGVHKDQALVLVNYGGGKGNDIWNLAMKIKESVKEKFDIDLHPEVNII